MRKWRYQSSELFLPEVEGEEGRGCLRWVVEGKAEDDERKCLPASIERTKQLFISVAKLAVYSSKAVYILPCCCVYLALASCLLQIMQQGRFCSCFQRLFHTSKSFTLFSFKWIRLGLFTLFKFFFCSSFLNEKKSITWA